MMNNVRAVKTGLGLVKANLLESQGEGELMSFEGGKIDEVNIHFLKTLENFSEQCGSIYYHCLKCVSCGARSSISLFCLPFHTRPWTLSSLIIVSISQFEYFSHTWYRVILKKVLFDIYRTFLDSKKEKKICYGKQRQRAISEQVSMIFGQCQNHQN